MDTKGAFISKWYALALWLLIVTLMRTVAAGNDDWGVTKFYTKKVSYRWSLRDYRRSRVGDLFKSDIFTGGDSKEYRWQLQLYPRGKWKRARHASLYLDLVSKQNITAEVKFTALDRRFRVKGYQSFKKRYPGEVWGFGEFMKIAALFASVVIDVDITFTYGVYRITKQCKRIDTGKCTSLPYNSNFMSDVDLWSEGISVPIKAHKGPLRAHSTYFRNELSLQPSAYMLMLPKNVQRDTLQEALKFIYTGKINTNQEVLKKLLALSNQLGMDRLKLHCERELCNAMTSKTASGILELAKSNNAGHLRRETENFIKAIQAGFVE